MQVLRSAADWSHGILREDSIQREWIFAPYRCGTASGIDCALEAYIGLIREANHCIYIENQFCKLSV